MRWFSRQRDPARALVVDGVVWGFGVGVGLPTLYGLFATVLSRDTSALRLGLIVGFVGMVVGTAIGAAVGLCGGLAMALCRRLHATPSTVTLVTISAALLGPVAVAELSGRDPQHAVLTLMALAVLPLVVDVLRLVHRGQLPRRTGRRCSP